MIFNIEDTSTQEEKIAKQIKIQSNGLYANLKAQYLGLYNLLWKSKHPELVMVAMGVDGQKMFGVSASLGVFLHGLKPDDADIMLTMPTDWSFTANNDGSVTITKV